jgi:opacity protein-like surface antigen
MKKVLFFAAALAAILSAACGSSPKTASGDAPQYVEQTAAYEVVDHKAKAIGQDVPEWVTRYIGDGLIGVEALEPYKDKYVFIGEDSGTNINALRQWATGFTVNQDVSRMVSNRVQAKFVGASVGSPDAEYGRYFENVVKAVSEAQFAGARKENDFWLLKRYLKADRKTTDREAYDYYVLITIDKENLQRQIDAVLNGAKADVPLTREQETAVDRVREAFYEGF